MKKILFICCLFAMFLITAGYAYATCGTPSVSVTYVSPSTNIGGYFKTTMDFAGCGDSDAAKLETLGHNYADAIVSAYHSVYNDDWAKSESDLLRQVVVAYNLTYGIYFKDNDSPQDGADMNYLIDRAMMYRHKVKDDGYAHYMEHLIVGMASALNPNGAPDRLWYLGAAENKLTVNELYLINFSEVMAYSGCSTVSAWGSATSDQKVIIGRNTDFYPGMTMDGHSGMLTAMHQVLYLKNQPNKYDTIMFNSLGTIAGGIGVNSEGLFISVNANQNKAIGPNFTEKYPFIVTREALGAYSSVSDSLISYITGKEYGIGWIATLADPDVVKIVENSWNANGSAYQHATRLYNLTSSTTPALRSDVSWDYSSFAGPVIVALNSNLMDSMLNNHSDSNYQPNVNHQVGRLASYNSIISKSGTISMDNVKSYLIWRHDAGNQNASDDDNDIFLANSDSATIQSVVYKPAPSGNTKTLYAHFAPCPNGSLVKRPNTPAYTQINFGFLGTP